MIRFKIDGRDAGKRKGEANERRRKEQRRAESTLQKFRKRQVPSWNCFDQLCRLLECQPADLIKWVDEKA